MSWNPDPTVIKTEAEERQMAMELFQVKGH